MTHRKHNITHHRTHLTYTTRQCLLPLPLPWDLDSSRLRPLLILYPLLLLLSLIILALVPLYSQTFQTIYGQRHSRPRHEHGTNFQRAATDSGLE